MVHPPAADVIGESAPIRARGAQTVGKALAVLDAFLDGAETLGLGELAGRAGLPRSTSHRLLAALVRHHYLERTDRGEYRLGIRLFQLGALVQGPRSLAKLADGEMTRLADATQISSFLSVRDGRRSICIHRVDRGQIIMAPYRIGETLPLHVGAAPLLLLAAMDPSDIEAYLAGPLERLTPVTEVRTAHIHRRLAQIRANRYVVAHPDDIAFGLSAVGAPIITPDGATVAALSLSGLTAHIDPVEPELVGEVQASAAAIARLLASDATAPRLVPPA